MRRQARADYVETYRSDDGRVVVEDRNGVRWSDEPTPSRWHRCWSQTRGLVSWFTLVHRCPCGAISLDGKGWQERNSRRTGR